MITVTKEDAKIIVYRICKLYFTQAKRMSIKDKADMLETWADVFKNESFEDVNRAISQYAKSGKPFMPNPPDIIQELIAMEDTVDNRLFIRLEHAADMAANPIDHIVVDDFGGYRWSEEHNRKVYFHPEAHVTMDYTQDDFSELPMELQEYAEDIDGLRAIHAEIVSNRILARMRFVDRLPEIRRRLDATS